MGLFTPFWKKEMDYKQKNYYRDVRVGEEKIAAMRDQKLLGQIALQSPESCFRDAAVKRLDSQETLLTVYRGEKVDYVRKTIASRLKEGDDLYRIAKNDSSADVREAAAAGITNEKVLADIAEKDSSINVRAAIIESKKIKDNQLLFRLAQKAERVRYDFGLIQGKRKYFSPGEELLKSITDKELLMKAVQGDFAGVHDSYILNRLDESQLLTLAADESIDKYRHLDIMRRIAAHEVKDERALADILCREKERDYNINDCIRTMKNSDCLETVITNANLDSIRITALEKLASLDAAKAAKHARALLPSLNQELQKQTLLSIIAKAEPKKTVESYLELTSEDHDLPIRWQAALALRRVDPSSAVEPLVTLLRDYKEHQYDSIGSYIVESLIVNATTFLKSYYQETADSAQKARIESLPNGIYYTHSAGLCEHTDTQVHFDLG